MTEMTKAVCWELATSTDSILGMRILLAGSYIGIQELSVDNARPRWKFFGFGSPAAATEAAVEITERFEKMQTATLIVPPGEIVLHPSELGSMATGGPISPALRARIFTSLQRRDPRVATVTASGAHAPAVTSAAPGE